MSLLRLAAALLAAYLLVLPVSAQTIPGGGGSGGGGSVTSVGTGACLTGGPITISGTLAQINNLDRELNLAVYPIPSSDNCTTVWRSNSGSAMADTIGQAGVGGFTTGLAIMVKNYDATATDTITPTLSTINNGASSYALKAGCSVILTANSTNGANGAWETSGDGCAGSGSVTSVTPSTGTATSNVGSLTACTATCSFFIDASFIPSFLGGLTLSNDGGTPNTVLDVAAGVAVSDDAPTIGAVLMKLPTFTGLTGGTWVVGSGSNKLDTGTIGAASWYHVFVIERTDTSVVDILFSLSATAPTMPTNYTKKRRIGSFRTSSSNIVAFVQRGTTFFLAASVLDVNDATLTTASKLETLGSVPTGVRVQPICRYTVSNAGTSAVLLNSPDEETTAPTTTNPFSAAPGFDQIDVTLTGGDQNTACPYLVTNTSAQVQARATAASTTLAIVTRGWIE